LINPAQTALSRDLRIISNYKTQWSSVGTPYKTGALSFELLLGKNKIKKGQMGVGFQLFTDKAGDGKLTTTQGMFSMSGIIKLNKTNKISTGIIAGFGQRSIDYNSLKWDQQYDGKAYDASISSGETQGGVVSYTYQDMGAGACWSHGVDQKDLYSKTSKFKSIVGVSAWHFGIPNYSFNQNFVDKLYSKIVAHANLEIPLIGTNIRFLPEAMYTNQGKLTELNMGGLVKYLLKEGSKVTGRIQGCAVAFGANYRYKDAIAISTLLEYGNMAIGISYDVNTSTLRKATNMRGGFEFALRYVTPSPFGGAKYRF
jgi:type IX secretion system PorP/SprF family membrane protein